MVGTDPLEVDQLLTGGELRCPDCTGELRPWGHARERVVRDATCVVALRPRRSWCTQCRCTHVLLPASTLVRRADTVAVIGRALLAKAAGAGHRRVAALLDRPVSTVRGWLRRFGVRAESLRVLFTALLHALDASAAAEGVTGSLFTDALEALGLAAAAAARLFGSRPAWQFASAASSGPAARPGPRREGGGQHELTLGSDVRRRQPSASLITTVITEDVEVRWAAEHDIRTTATVALTGPGRSGCSVTR